jgi:hypothetical protein
MSDAQSTNSGDTAVTEVTETLDDVISSYSVQAPVAQEQRSQPVQPRQYSAPKLDPLDDNSVNQFSNYVAENNSALNSQIQEISQKLTQFEQKEAELRIEAEINKAIETVNEGIGLNPKLVRVHLELAAQEKPAFKSIWENRNNDPKTYNRALKAIQKEISDTYSVRQDPELTETQSAIQQSQKSMASSSSKSSNSIDEQLKAAEGSEFDRIWNSIGG